jgi:CxxC motif-containing protein
MVRSLLCIECPQSCLLEVSGLGEEITVANNKCERGRAYAAKEITNPARTLTTTVKTFFPDFPRLPVRSAAEIPLNLVIPTVRELDTVIVCRRLQPGDIVLDRIPGTDVPLIATGDMTAEESD